MATPPRALYVSIIVLVCWGIGARVHGADRLGEFDKAKDLYLAQFDLKTDVDDVHSIAGVATLLADRRFDGVMFHAIAGAYGTQGGLYVPANELFNMAFGKHWSDAHTDFDRALVEVSDLSTGVLSAGGKIWIAEAGQSDFSAALLRKLKERLPGVDLKDRFNVVQHSDWNESVTTPADLAFVKQAGTYHRIPDGNAVGNGTPGFRSDQAIAWRKHVKDPNLIAIWEKAIAIANKYNGAAGRYLNGSIERGGLDFSDVVESAWIFGFANLADANAFFQHFATAPAVEGE